MGWLKAIGVWLVFILAESCNGAIREFWIIPALGDELGHRVSFAIGTTLVLAIATLFIPWLKPSRVSQLIQIGLLWVCLTVAFEVLLGRFILGYSWQRIGSDYDLLRGGLMPFGLLLLALAPLIAAKLRGIYPGTDETP